MSWADEIRLIDINQPATWPAWFMVLISLLVSLLLQLGGWHFLIQNQLRVLESERARETELRSAYSVKKGMVVNLPAYKAQMMDIAPYTLAG